VSENAKPPISADDGHRHLIEDLEALLAEAQTFQFHDFKNTIYAAPKVALYMKLTELVAAVKEGRYDN